MSESNRYYAVEIKKLTAALRGESLRFNQAIPQDLSEATRRALNLIKDSSMFGWDVEPMRSQSWDVFAELNHVISNAVRIEGEDVGWDAWSGRHRLLIPVLDWNPLVRGFGTRWASRPLPPIYFASRHMMPLAKQTAYTESWPHGFFLRSEYREVIPGLHALIDSSLQTLHGEESKALSTLRPGQPLPASILDSVAGDDDVGLAWQTTRAMRLYNALCLAGAKDRDLFSLGY